ncbi:MAG: anthranilate phosphoribosyltransferase 2 [Fimbriimonadales bacterium]
MARMQSLEPYLQAVVDGRSLSTEEARAAMGVIMDGEAPPTQIAGFLVALRMKGETGEEVAGFAQAMRDKVTPVRTTRQPLVDTCGTGGDGFKTFNISTAAAFIAAGAGAAVAKHGNRAITGRCGSADVLEALGAKLDLNVEREVEALENIGIAFLFAPNHHPAMRHATPVRRELRLRTVFNILGPLTNPAGARRQVIGVYDPALIGLVAEALAHLGVDRAVVFHGEPGMDEVSAVGTTRYAVIEGSAVQHGEWRPEDLGLRRVRPEEIAAGDDAGTNARLLTEAISEVTSSLSEAAIATAGAALWAAGEGDVRTGVERARESVASGAAARKLEEYIRFTNEHS